MDRPFFCPIISPKSKHPFQIRTFTKKFLYVVYRELQSQT